MRSLQSVLFDLPAEKLRNIVDKRLIDTSRLKLVKDKKQLSQLLSTELVRQDSISYALRACNARQIRLLKAILPLEPHHSVLFRKVMTSLITSNEEVVGQTLDSLADLGLAFRTADLIYIPEQIKTILPIPISSRLDIDRCLNAYDAVTLKRLATNLGCASSTKSQNIEDIKRTLFSQSKLSNLLSALSSEELAVMNYLLANDSYGYPETIMLNVLPKYREDFFRYDWQDRWKRNSSRNPIDTLLGKGLIYATSYAYGYNLFIVIPGDLIPRLTDRDAPNIWNSPEPALIPLKDPPAYKTQHTSLVKDVVSMLGGFSVSEMGVTNTGFVHKTGLKNIAKTLLLPDEKYANFLYALCREGDMIALNPKSGFYEVTKEGVSWLSKSSSEQIAYLFAIWRQSFFYGEMYEEPFQKSSSYRTKDLTISVRKIAIDFLSKPAIGAFIDTESVVTALSYQSPMLLNENANVNQGFAKKMETFVDRIVNQCLYWLGAVELGWKTQPHPPKVELPAAGRAKASKTAAIATPPEEKAEPYSYTFTQLGQALIGVENVEIPEGNPREYEFIIQANSEIFLPPYLAPAIHYPLTLFTEIPKNGASNVVVLSKDAIRKTLDRGLTIEDILAFLRKHSRTGIPQNVEYVIREVGGKHGHIHVGSALMYLTTDTPNLMKELKAKREFSSLFVKSLSDTIAVLDGSDVDKLLALLRKASYLPVSDDLSGNSKLSIPDLATQPDQTPAQVKQTDSKGAKKTVDVPSILKPTVSLVDWDLIAKEDEIVQNGIVSSNSNRPEDAVQNQENIRFVLQHALKSKSSIEICYQPKKNEDIIIQIGEPRNLIGSFATIFFPLERMTKTMNLNTVKWVRKLP